MTHPAGPHRDELRAGAGRLDPAVIAWGADGLIAGIVQDAADGRVLMLGWLDREALEATQATGEVHFHSRTRARLWRKGETSGNVLRLADAALDCDADALLLRVVPAGPTCHTGARSCFDVGGVVAASDAGSTAWPGADAAPADAARQDAARQDFAWLESLWSTITARARVRPEASYTARLLAGGVDAVARKVAEEATEVVLAAKDDAALAAVGPGPRDQGALAGELADLVYHALVLCAERGLPPAAVIEVLRSRHRA